MRILSLIGAPLCGKGTQGALLAKALGLKHISTGDVIRSEIEKNSELGAHLNFFLSRGEIVPDEIMREILFGIVRDNIGSEGFILDGFPRAIGQVQPFLQFLKEQSLQFEALIILDITKKEFIVRGQYRRESENRVDDEELIQLRRWNNYINITLPAINLMSASVKAINVSGEGEIIEVHERIIKKLK